MAFHAQFLPGSAFAFDIEHKGQQAVDDLEQSGFGAGAGFLFFPDIGEVVDAVAFVAGKALDAVAFGLMSVGAGIGVEKGVARVDLAEVVD